MSYNSHPVAMMKFVTKVNLGVYIDLNKGMVFHAKEAINGKLVLKTNHNILKAWRLCLGYKIWLEMLFLVCFCYSLPI